MFLGRPSPQLQNWRFWASLEIWASPFPPGLSFPDLYPTGREPLSRPSSGVCSLASTPGRRRACWDLKSVARSLPSRWCWARATRSRLSPTVLAAEAARAGAQPPPPAPPQTSQTHRPGPPPRPRPVGSPRPGSRPAGTTSGRSPGRRHPPLPPTCGHRTRAPLPPFPKKTHRAGKGQPGRKGPGAAHSSWRAGAERQPRRAQLSDHPGAGEPRAARERGCRPWSLTAPPSGTRTQRRARSSPAHPGGAGPARAPGPAAVGGRPHPAPRSARGVAFPARGGSDSARPARAVGRPGDVCAGSLRCWGMWLWVQEGPTPGVCRKEGALQGVESELAGVGLGSLQTRAGGGKGRSGKVCATGEGEIAQGPLT